VTAFTAQPRLFKLLIVCVTFIVAWAAMAAGPHPAQANVNVPAAQAVPVAPTATLTPPLMATHSTPATLPEPMPVPSAPGTRMAAIAHPTKTAVTLPATSSRLLPLGLAVASGLLLAGTLILRRSEPSLRAVAW
jgi:hypothetical protein